MKRLFGLDDGEQGTTRLSETLYATADLWSRPEFSFPRGEFEWSVFLQQAAVVGEQSFVGIRNPAGSGVLIGIRELDYTNLAGLVDENMVANTAFTPTGSGTPTQTDLRITNFPNPSLATVSFTHHQVGNLGGATLRQTNVLAAVDMNPRQCRVVLTPGFSYYLTYDAGSLNAVMKASISGWERKALPGELLTF